MNFAEMTSHRSGFLSTLFLNRSRVVSHVNNAKCSLKIDELFNGAEIQDHNRFRGQDTCLFVCLFVCFSRVPLVLGFSDPPNSGHSRSNQVSME